MTIRAAKQHGGELQHQFLKGELVNVEHALFADGKFQLVAFEIGLAHGPVPLDAARAGRGRKAPRAGGGHLSLEGKMQLRFAVFVQRGAKLAGDRPDRFICLLYTSDAADA